jgi:hypothetical protein
MEMSGQFQIMAALSLGKRPVPLNRYLGAPYNQTGHGSEERNLLPLPGLNSDSVVIQSMPYFTN